MRLHEYYFGNMVKAGQALSVDSALFKKLTEDFGSYDHWQRDFKATGTMRGIGWVVLCLDPMANRTFNMWINEHDVGHLAGAIPLLVMDVFEHAYMGDYDLRRADYIEAFFKAIDWAVVAGRLDKSPKVI